MFRRFVLAICLLGLVNTSFAQDASENAIIEFYGTIQSANATALVVNGRVVDIQNAQISTPLVAGIAVQITAIFAQDGSLTAEQVETVPPGFIPGIVIISGLITGITDNTITIQGHVIVTSDTVVSGNPAIGGEATIYAAALASDNWQARVVIAHDTPANTPLAPVETPEVAPPAAISTGAPAEVVPPAQTPEVGIGEDFRIEGTLEAVDANSITVDGNRYFIGSARIEGALTVGARVRVEIRIINGGEWIVEEVRVRD